MVFSLWSGKSAPRVFLISKFFRIGLIARCIDKVFELFVGHFGGVHLERANRDFVDGLLVFGSVIAAQHECPAGNPDHPRRIGIDNGVQLVAGRHGAGPADDEGLGDLPLDRVRHADDRALADRRVAVEHLLHLARPDLEGVRLHRAAGRESRRASSRREPS